MSLLELNLQTYESFLTLHRYSKEEASMLSKSLAARRLDTLVVASELTSVTGKRRMKVGESQADNLVAAVKTMDRIMAMSGGVGPSEETPQQSQSSSALNSLVQFAKAPPKTPSGAKGSPKKLTGKKSEVSNLPEWALKERKTPKPPSGKLGSKAKPGLFLSSPKDRHLRALLSPRRDQKRTKLVEVDSLLERVRCVL